MATLIAAPPIQAPRRAGAIEYAVPVIDGGDPHIGQGIVYETEKQVSAALWTDYCETPGAAKTFEEIQTTVTSQSFTLVQGAKCRMLNEWDTLGDRLSGVYERGEWRALEQAVIAGIVAGNFCPAAAGSGTGLAAAEAELWRAARSGYIIMSVTSFYTILATAADSFVVSGNKITTALGTPVILIPEAGATLYVTGPITIWRSPRSEPHPVMEVPYTNQFLLLTERIATVAIECADSANILTHAL